MLVRTRPSYADPLAHMTRELDHFLEPFTPRSFAAALAEPCAKEMLTPMNIWEDDSSFHVEVETPGVDMEDIEVLACPESLTIRGERTEPTPQDATRHVRERFFGSFERTVSLPSEVDAENVHATLENGILHVTLPRSQAGHRQHKVKIFPGKCEHQTASAS